MTGFVITALAVLAVWLFAALLETDHERRRAIRERNDANASLAAALRSLAAVEEAQRNAKLRRPSYTIVYADGRFVPIHRN